MKNYINDLAVILFFGLLTYFSISLYIKHEAARNFIELIDSISTERDTTSSLRNYEVLTDSINNLCKQWLENDTEF